MLRLLCYILYRQFGVYLGHGLFWLNAPIAHVVQSLLKEICVSDLYFLNLRFL